MREYIKSVKIIGKLNVEDKYVFEDVRGEYKHDIYSNKGMAGFFEVKRLSADFLNNFQTIRNFTFIGNGVTINGEITGWTLPSGREDNIKFSIKDVTEWILYEEKEPKKIFIEYKIPYILLLARRIRNYFGFNEDCIIKFISDEFKIKIKNIEIIFFEYISLVKHVEPDLIFNRMLHPKIRIELTKDENIIEKLNYLENIMNDSMILISFIIFKRCNVFGYTANIYDQSDKLLQVINYKTSEKGSGEDYIEEDNREFNNYFIEDNISKLIEAYLNLCNEEKNNFLKIIYSYLTIGELKIMEPMFKDAYHVLEAISKIIVKPKANMNSEELIEEACFRNSININKIKFEEAKESNKLKWLITEYRNSLIHFNYNYEINNETLFIEFSKMMNLIRKLMISYLEPSLIEFPYPRNRYRI